MHSTVTEFNKYPGKYLKHAMEEPIVIERSGEPIVVIVSYEYCQKMEDAYWGKLAAQTKKEPSLNAQETMKFLLEDDT